MKKINQLVLTTFSIVALGFFISCEGPAGPAGDPGTDGNNSCLVCHTQEGMDAIASLYDLSGHKAAASVGYAGGRASCAQCHSHEGFMNFLAATPGGEFSDIAYPTRIDCHTCHGNHTSLEDSITAPIRIQTAVVGISDGTEFDFGNNSNLCANCHQSRRDYTYYEGVDSVEIDDVMIAVADGEIGINSSHAGPHHGPQTNLLFGNGGYGASSTGTHSDLGCTTCHMGTATGTDGGHSFTPSIDNCTACHEGETNFDVNGKQTDFDTRMTAIAAKLVEAGALAYDADEDSYHPHVSIVPEAVFKGFWNYMMLAEDASRGVHNPSYMGTLLSTAEANLGL